MCTALYYTLNILDGIMADCLRRYVVTDMEMSQMAFLGEGAGFSVFVIFIHGLT